MIFKCLAQLIVSKEVDEDCAHVVAASEVLHILGNKLVEELVEHCLPIAVFLTQFSYKGDHFLAVGYVTFPNSIASE